MHAISVKQPYASLIAAGIKTIETKSKPTAFRGELYLHASRGLHKDFKDPEFVREALPYLAGIMDAAPRPSRARWEFSGSINPRFKRPSDQDFIALEEGVIIAKIEILDCLPAWDILELWRKLYGDDAEEFWLKEWTLGDLSSDRYGYVIRVLQVYENPLPARGQLGIYDIEKLNPGISEKLEFLR